MMFHPPIKGFDLIVRCKSLSSIYVARLALITRKLLTHSVTHPLTHSHTLSLSLTHTHTHTHAQANTNTHKDTHTQTCLLLFMPDDHLI